MNTKNEEQRPADPREAGSKAPVAESSESEPMASKEASDARETTEGGYGWGV